MLSKFFIDRPRFAFVIAIVICIAGAVSIFVMPVSQYPDITPSQVKINATYPGADSETLLKTVVENLETQVNGVKRMIYISSTCADDGTALITVTFPAETDGDINTVNVQNQANIAQPRLPQEVKNQGLVIKEKSPNILLVITLYSPKGTYDSIFLSNYVNIYINDEIKRIPGIGDTSVLGSANYSMRMWLNPDKLADMNLSVTDVIDAIKQQNVQVSAGAIGDAPCNDNQAFRYTIQTQGRLETVKQFEDIVVKAMPGGDNVKMSDIARVELGAENYNQVGMLNNTPASLLCVYQLPEANGLQIAEACRNKLEELKKRFPPDLQYGIQYDTTKFVQSSINEVVITLFEAVALVILVTFIFLQDWRATLVPTIAIPVSLVGTFAFLLAMGYSINLITLFGLVLAIGIVVDDAILVIESVNKMIEKDHLSPKEAAKKTMELVTSPVIATTAVLLAMFVPVCFLPGITGEMYRQFGVTISVAVSISSINALTLSPALCATIIRGENPGKRKIFFFRWFNSFFDWITAKYSAIVSRLVRISFVMILFYLLGMVVCYKLYSLIPTGFIPNEDQGAFMINVQLPEAAASPRTEKVVRAMTEIAKNTPGVQDQLMTTGFSIITNTTSSNNAFGITVLDDWSKRTTPQLSQRAIMRKLAAEFNAIPGAAINPFPVPAIPGIGTTGGFSFVLLDVSGGDVNVRKLAEVANKVVYEANQRPEIFGAFSTFRANVPRIYLNFDREKALKLGVPISEINNALQGFEGYAYINDFNKFGKTFKVEIQAEQDYRSELDDIGSLYVKNNKGEMVPMSTLVQPEIRFGAQYINRYNLYPSVTINGNSAPGYSSGQAMKAMEEIAAKVLPPGMSYDWTDMSYQEKLAGNKAVFVFGFALLFIYLFLVAQYESWMIPMAVMLSVPIAFFGAILFIWIRGLDNNIYSQVGFVLLFGLACKTAILIVEFAKEQREKGTDIIGSAVFAAKLRFRAVLMTAISFILGVLPLVIATGPGANCRHSLGSVVFGGMLISCIFGTILVPSFYVAVQKIIEKFSPPRPEQSAKKD